MRKRIFTKKFEPIRMLPCVESTGCNGQPVTTISFMAARVGSILYTKQNRHLHYRQKIWLGC